MDPLVQALMVAVVTFLTSSTGFWVYLKNRTEQKDTERANLINLLMGLAQAKIHQLGRSYIAQGTVSIEEYDDLKRYLYTPYHSLGGNGTVERIMHAVERLPITDKESITEEAYKVKIRRDDATGFAELDEDFEKFPYEGEDRRGKER